MTNAVFTFVMENNHMIFYYECKDELYLIGNNAQQCQSNSEWTQQKFTCSSMYIPCINVLYIFFDRHNMHDLKYHNHILFFLFTYLNEIICMIYNIIFTLMFFKYLTEILYMIL